MTLDRLHRIHAIVSRARESFAMTLAAHDSAVEQLAALGGIEDETVGLTSDADEDLAELEMLEAELFEMYTDAVRRECA